MPVLDVERLEGACTQVFEGAGLGADEARQIAHSLVLSNLMGHDSHGVIRVVQYVQALEEGRVHAGREIAVVREADASAVVDGGWGFGQTVCHQAMALAMEKAKQRSVAVVELFNSGHIGRLGEYVEVAAEGEMIGIVMCNNHGGGLLQHPFGGIDARMSPNPIAVGIPTGGRFSDCRGFDHECCRGGEDSGEAQFGRVIARRLGDRCRGRSDDGSSKILRSAQRGYFAFWRDFRA